MKTYATDLVGEQSLVKSQKYVENFYKERYEKDLKKVQTEKIVLQNNLNNKTKECDDLKANFNNKNAQVKSLSDQNASLRKKIEELEKKNKNLVEGQKDMVPLFSENCKSGKRRHIELD